MSNYRTWGTIYMYIFEKTKNITSDNLDISECQTLI